MTQARRNELRAVGDPDWQELERDWQEDAAESEPEPEAEVVFPEHGLTDIEAMGPLRQEADAAAKAAASSGRFRMMLQVATVVAVAALGLLFLRMGGTDTEPLNAADDPGSPPVAATVEGDLAATSAGGELADPPQPARLAAVDTTQPDLAADEPAPATVPATDGLFDSIVWPEATPLSGAMGPRPDLAGSTPETPRPVSPDAPKTVTAAATPDVLPSIGSGTVAMRAPVPALDTTVAGMLSVLTASEPGLLEAAARSEGVTGRTGPSAADPGAGDGLPSIGPAAVPHGPIPAVGVQLAVASAPGMREGFAPSPAPVDLSPGRTMAHVDFGAPEPGTGPLADTKPPLAGLPASLRPMPRPYRDAAAAAIPPELTTELKTDPAAGRTGLSDARIVIHYNGAGHRSDAQKLANALSQAGASRPEIRAVDFAVASDSVRYFHSVDRSAAEDAVFVMLRQAPAVRLIDFTSFTPPPRQSTIELWLASS